MVKYDEKSCGVVLFKEDGEKIEYLLLHYPSGHWEFPKGHIEEGEDEIQTAKRELWEETGIDRIEIIPGFREPIAYKFRNKGKPSHKQVIFFLAKTAIDEITISFEHQGFIWLPYEEALKKVTFENARNILNKAQAHINPSK